MKVDRVQTNKHKNSRPKSKINSELKFRKIISQKQNEDLDLSRN